LWRFLGNSLYMYSHGHGISSVVVIQLALAVRQVLYTHPTFEFLTSMSCHWRRLQENTKISMPTCRVTHSDANSVSSCPCIVSVDNFDI
jgi:hypothetical protein